jgi:hypothetical protein
MNKTKCKTTRHRCSSNKKCYRKSSWQRKNLIKRCKVGTRKCRDNKCHKKKTVTVTRNSPIKAITNAMVSKIATSVRSKTNSKTSKTSQRPPWRY